eukprot:comp23855_c1_seq1/m.41712 comp23855_c1_seq1/g.41712  ORF comp23855_c1_seq1/g.41712 comp23855_c1_seq1/m.41712 type:complete len:400 (-) comp23855_c1_seq1:264-1463(-)
MAGLAKGSQNKAKDVPPFLRKLYHMVDEPETNTCIRWNDAGDGFILVNAEIFARDVLPRYFKHNNFATFVRQLNMYDFSKVGLVDRGVVSVGEFHAWQFTHPYFLRGRPDLIINIHRKTYVPAAEKKVKTEHDLDDLVRQFEDLRTENQDMRATINRLREESEELKRQNMILMQNSQVSLARTGELHGTVEKIIKFLATVYSPEFIRQQLSQQPALLTQLSQAAQAAGSFAPQQPPASNAIVFPGTAANNQLVPVYSYPTIDVLRSAAAGSNTAAGVTPMPTPMATPTQPPLTMPMSTMSTASYTPLPSASSMASTAPPYGPGAQGDVVVLEDSSQQLDSDLDLDLGDGLSTMLPDSIEAPDPSDQDMLQFLSSDGINSFTSPLPPVDAPGPQQQQTHT